MIEPAIVLLIWPFLAVGIAAAYGMASGAIWMTLIGYMFLPDSFNVDLPGLPPYSKYTAVSAGLVLSLLFFSRRDQKEPLVYSDKLAGIAFMLIVILLLLSPFGTYLTNRNGLFTGGLVRRGLSLYDVITTLSAVLIVLVPYYVGRRWVATPQQHARLLTAMVIIGLIYSLLALYEVRMSPQLNRTVYGYFPHSWVQHLRGGFRPVIFLRHGLWLGFLLLTMILACFAMSRQDPKRRVLYLGAGLWIMLVLFLSRNLGASMLAVIFSPIVLFLSTRIQARIVAVVAVLFLSFPVLRSTEVITFEGFLERVEAVSPKRAASFEYRVRNEDALLARAQKNPWFGWGGWARALVFDDQGRNTSVQDGAWIIVIGERGWVGYFAHFGLIAFPLIMLRRTAKRKPLEPATAGLAVITAANLVYIIPNSTVSSIGWLTFGALAGYVQFDLRRANASVPDDDPEPQNARGPMGYSRFNNGRHQTTSRPASALTRTSGALRR